MIEEINLKKNIDTFDEKVSDNEKKGRGRPKTINLSKEEYHRQYYLQRYSQNKDEIKAACAKNSKKYRDSYKLLLEIYEKRELDEDIFTRIERIFE